MKTATSIFSESVPASSSLPCNYSSKLPEDDLDEITAYITVLPDATHALLEPIPIQLKPVGNGEWMASFDEANIAMTGDTPEEAKKLLAYNIIDAVQLFHSQEKVLIPDLQQSLMVLRHYIEIAA